MLDYLKTVFGGDIHLSPASLPSGTPFYIRDNYTVNKLLWHQSACLVLRPNDASIRLPALKKHLQTLAVLSGMPCALALDQMTSLQRKNLIESQVPFISDRQQIYLPFWGSLFSENFKKKLTVGDLAPAAQLITLYLYYQNSDEKYTVTELSKKLNISKATVTRSIEALSAQGVIRVHSDGYRKWIMAPFDKQDMLARAMPLMKSPVERVLYVTDLPADRPLLTGGIRALSQMTMLGAKESDGSFVTDRKGSRAIPKKSIMDEDAFHDFGGRIIEVWSYPPQLLSPAGSVDDISLLLSLMDHTNERVQKALDEIRTKHGLVAEEQVPL